MITLPAVAATLVAGLLSFFSPCAVPLLPAYLSCVSGIGAAELGQSRFRARLVAGSLLYVAGFSVVFILLGLGAGGVGHALHTAARPLEVVGGVLLILLGLVVADVLRSGAVLRERRFELPERVRQRGLAAAFPVGVVFGLAWTPCVGPYLGAALAVAAVSAQALSGALLLGVYAMGLGAPFVLVALLWASLPRFPQRVARWTPLLARAGGAMTVLLGVLLVTGQYTLLTSRLAQLSVGH